MRQLWALPLVIGFSVYDDLYARPQYEIQFSDTQVEGEKILMMLGSSSYLCTIPHETSPIKEEFAIDFSKALTSGESLLNSMGSYCLYFISGFWTYAFCPNREIRQFHQLVIDGMISYPPQEDLEVDVYLLGFPKTDFELQSDGEQKYLVQRYKGGTECDLTGRQRRTDVHFYCHPGRERVVWVKEISLCRYLMLVHTPKLCEDPLFMAPNNTANVVVCSEVNQKGFILQVASQ